MADTSAQATKLTTVHLPVAIHKAIKEQTKAQGISMKHFIAQACREKIAVMKASA